MGLSVVNKNKGIVIEAGYSPVSESDTSEYQIVLMDTNVPLLIPEFPTISVTIILLSILSIILFLFKKKIT